MWYIADILFAKSQSEGEELTQLEGCNVLFEAKSAVHVCVKAVVWAKDHETDNDFKYVGISHIWSLDDDRPDDGTEIAGSFFEEKNFWARKDEFIPDPSEIPIIKMEENPDTPLGELVPDDVIEQYKKIFE